MAERFLQSMGENPAVSDYINSLRDKLKIKAAEVRLKSVISAEFNPAKCCFRFSSAQSI